MSWYYYENIFDPVDPQKDLSKFQEFRSSWTTCWEQLVWVIFILNPNIITIQTAYINL